jgi:CubicO group peptidase (beta-lactamase class C family)
MSGGLSKTRLDRMRAVLSAHVDAGRAPGVVALIARGDDVHVEAVGHMDLGGGRRIERDTIFRIASMSKPVTAVAAMILIEQCVIRLDEPIDDLVPELADRRVLKSMESELDDTVPADRPITVRDLLTFRMGNGLVLAPPDAYPILREVNKRGGGAGPPKPSNEPPPDEWIARLGDLPLMEQPGTRWRYHTGAEVLSVLIGRATGGAFGDFLRERIFEPLGMSDTGFSVPREKLGRFATSYLTDWNTRELSVYDDSAGGDWSRPPAFESGGGGLVSTADDYLVFARMLLNGGVHEGERIVSRPSVELMTSDQLRPEHRVGPDVILGDDMSWGFGVGVIIGRHDLMNVGTYGWDGGLGTSWRNDARESLTGICLTQAAFVDPHLPKPIQDFWTCAYQAIDD